MVFKAYLKAIFSIPLCHGHAEQNMTYATLKILGRGATLALCHYYTELGTLYVLLPRTKNEDDENSSTTHD